MIISTLSFAFGGSFHFFILGSIALSLSLAFTSGTTSAFLHNTLVGLGREKDYANVSGKIGANISLISAVIIVLLPFLTEISLVLPIKAYLVFDLLGILIAFLLVSPPTSYTAQDEEGVALLTHIKKFKGSGFYTLSIFFSLLTGVVLGTSVYKMPYLESLEFPVILIGTVMAGSRVVWFLIGHHLHLLKKIALKHLLLAEVFFFSGSFILASRLSNPYIIAVLLAVLTGYYRARKPLINDYFLTHFLPNKRYKATMLSIKAQGEQLFQSLITFFIGMAMGVSFSLGFLITGVVALALLLIAYPFAKKVLEKKGA